MADFLATIREISSNPNRKTINVRSGPGRGNPKVRDARIGQSGLPVLDVLPDANGEGFNGKTYQWLKLQFPDGGTAWARDDLVDVQGDGSEFGYGNVPRKVIAFSLDRDTSRDTETPPPTDTDTGTDTDTDSPPPTDPETDTGTDTVAGTSDVTVQIDVAANASGSPDTNVQVLPKTTVGSERFQVNVSETLGAPQTGESARVTFTVTVVMSDEVDEDQPDITPGEPPVSSDEPGRVIIQAQDGMNLRADASTRTAVLARVPYETTLDIISAKPGIVNGDPYRWVQVRHDGKTGWLRRDYLRLQGDFAQYGLGATDRYPSPVRNGWWVRGFNLDEDNTQFVAFHKGWDIGGNVGEPILAGPQGGVVTKTAFCRACGTEGASSVTGNVGVNDPDVLNSEEWNFGLGHYVVVRYNNNILPASTQQILEQRNLDGAHLFVAYAHLDSMNVSQGARVQGGSPLGTLGNSGNSTGPHLHLEVRAGRNANAAFYALSDNLLNPGVLFLR